MVMVDEERWDLEVLRGAVRYQRWVLSSFGDLVRGRVLEVGAGNGNFTRWLAGRADRLVALEPDAAVRAELETLGLPNVEILPTPIEAFRVNGRPFDCVVMINVLEHIDDDARALRAAHGLLRPGGALCALVPAHPRLYGSLDRKYGHLRRYTRRECAEALELAGFRVAACRYFNPIGALGWGFVGRLLRRRRVSRSAVRLTEWLAVPAGRVLERLSPSPFGQSVVAVATRSIERLELAPFEEGVVAVGARETA